MISEQKIIGYLIIISLVLPLALSVPPIPTEFYGTATIYDYNRTPMPAGTEIIIYAGNISCGRFNVINPGFYGSLTCIGDDNYTSLDEGAEQGQNIIFMMEGQPVQVFGDTVWYYGEYQMVNITPVPACGNGWCELTETCRTCAEDCGLCPQNVTPTNDTGEGGSVPGGSSSSGSSSSDGGGGGTGGSAGGFYTGGTEGFFGDITNVSMIYCQEDWICTEWQPEICPVSELQTRECTDRNECGTEQVKPETNKTCIYQGTCFDNIINQDETDRDCGGMVCDPCDLGKRCSLDYDCKSGFCHPFDKVCAEPTCTDGFRNQGEEGVDCGGPCLPCSLPSLEEPARVIRFIATGCGPFPWIFLLVASIVTLLIYLAGKMYIKKVKADPRYKKLKKVEQLTRMYDLNRNLNTFTVLVSMLELAIALYSYYLCDLQIWYLLMFLIFLPIAIALVIKRYVYDEKRKKLELRKMILRHEDYLKKLIKIEREEIKKDEAKVFKVLDEDIDYKQFDKEVALLLKDIRFMIAELLSSKEENPFEIENSLADTIQSLKQEKYKQAIDNSEKIQGIMPSLNIIEKIHRDVLLLYKDLEKDFEIEEDIENMGSGGKGTEGKDSGPDDGTTEKPQAIGGIEESEDITEDNPDVSPTSESSSGKISKKDGQSVEKEAVIKRGS